MKTDFKKSFIKDLKKIRDQDLKKRVAGAIERVDRQGVFEKSRIPENSGAVIATFASRLGIIGSV